MSEPTHVPRVEPHVEFIIVFKRTGLLGLDRHLYRVKGTIGPPPYTACCNICQFDKAAKRWAEAEVFGMESGGLTEAFKRAEIVLTARHRGFDKRITFDFTESW